MPNEMTVVVKIHFSDPVNNTTEVVDNIEKAITNVLYNSGISPVEEDAFVTGIDIEYCEKKQSKIIFP